MPHPETPRAKMLRQTVFDLCDRLAGEGRRPANQTVRRELGGGSMSDIQALVEEWRERREAAALAAMAAPEAPPEFSDLWPVIWRLAAQIHGAARRSWEESRRELETSLEDLHGELDEERALRAEAQDRLRAGEAGAAALRETAERARKAAEERAAELERRLLRAEGERDAWQVAMSGLGSMVGREAPATGG